MTRFILVHGACHGAWCWRDVLPFLNKSHKAQAIDLPGRDGGDGTVTLDHFAKAILAAIGDEPAILVGHSMAGFPISLAAERAPGRVRALVYLCAFVPAPGQSVAAMRRAGPRQTLAPAIRVAANRQTFTFDPERVADLFYHDCPASAAAFARAHLCPEPVLPQETPVHLTARHASVPRHYILCTEDRAIPPEYQAQMARDFPAGQVTRLPTAHSPFFAAPEALAKRLIAIAEAL